MPPIEPVELLDVGFAESLEISPRANALAFYIDDIDTMAERHHINVDPALPAEERRDLIDRCAMRKHRLFALIAIEPDHQP